MIKIITDSTAYAPTDFLEKHDITVIPLRYLYRDQEFIEGAPGTFGQFFDDFTKTKLFPKTSQPSLELFIEEYNKAIEKGDEVLVFTISSTVSGSNNAANLAKEQCKDPTKVTVFDSLALAQTILGYIMEAVKMRDAGKTVPEIVERIKSLQETSIITFIPDTLEYIFKGGRIGRVTAVLGSILKIRPIVTFKKGILSNKNSFGLQKAMKDLISTIPPEGKLVRIFILHIAKTTLFEQFKENVMNVLKARSDFGKFEIYEGEVGPVVATHAGPAVGLAWSSEPY